MKPTVFYTLFLGIFLAGQVAGQAPRLVLPVGHTNTVDFVSISPDGKKFISSSDDNKLKLWELNTGYLLLDLPASTFRQAPEFSSNGNYFLVNTDSVVFVYSYQSGEVVYRYKAGEGNSVLLARFSPDGSKLAVVTPKEFELIDLSNQKSLLQIEEDARSFAFSTDGVFLALDMGTEVRVYEQGTEEIYTMYEEGSPLVRSFSFSPDGLQIMILYDQNILRVWNTREARKIFEKNYGNFDELDFAGYAPDGSSLVVLVSNDISNRYPEKRKQGLILHSLQGSLKAKLFTSDSLILNSISSVKFIQGSGQILTASANGALAIWELKSGKLLWTIKRQDSRFNDADITRDGKYIVACGSNPYITLADVKQKRFIMDFLNHSVFIPEIRYVDSSAKLYAPGGRFLFWDSKTGQPVNIPPRKLNSPVINDYGNQLAEVTDEEVILLNKDNYIKRKSIKGWVYRIVYSPVGERFLMVEGKKLSILDSKNGQVITGEKNGPEAGSIIKWSDNGQFIVSAFEDDTVRVLRSTDLSVIVSLPLRKYKVHDLVFSPDSKLLAIASDKLIFWDILRNQQDSELDFYGEEEEKENPWGFEHVVFSFDGSRLLASSHSTIKCLDMYEMEWLFTSSHNYSVRTLEFSGDGKSFVSSSWDNTAAIWDAATGSLLHSLPHDNFLAAATFSHDGKKVASTGYDNICKVWNTATGKLLYSFIVIDETDYLLMSKEGYYTGTQAAAKKLHYVSADLRTISFEQLDIQFNRPDKVLISMGNSDTTLISVYRKAWEKRIKKLKIDTTAFQNGWAVPECEINNRDNIGYEQVKKEIQITIRASDAQFALDRFNCWVNDVPLFGQRGISIRKRNERTFDTIITLPLSMGTNRIEAVVSNINGTESYRMPLVVKYVPRTKEKESLRFIGIGIDRFSEKGHDLQYSVKDIRDLSVQLRKKYGNDIRIDTLFNEQVNTEQVKALKQQLLQTTENDKVILAYSGHGLLSKDYDYYLSTYKVNFDQPEQNGLPYDELENLLDSIPARRKLMLIDACHSGEVDKEEMTRISAAADSLQQKGTKGGKPTYTGKTTLGMKNSFELMQSLFVNVGKSTGATVISAAAGTQFALERGDLKNGVFTYSILEAMKKYPSIKVSELRKIVGERVEQLTNGLQRPTSRNEAISSDWSF